MSPMLCTPCQQGEVKDTRDPGKCPEGPGTACSGGGVGLGLGAKGSCVQPLVPWVPGGFSSFSHVL